MAVPPYGTHFPYGNYTAEGKGDLTPLRQFGWRTDIFSRILVHSRDGIAPMQPMREIEIRASLGAKGAKTCD